jgi:3-deoxy-D-manno-octulosonate 8-phosphate phosphatase (KDO 8-P phosphatase)
MTDGRIFWLDGHGWTRHFHIHDGYGLKLLMKCGIEIAVISGGESEDVRKRMEFLKIPYVFLGDEDKLKALEKIRDATGLEYERMAFMGDDLFDLPVLERVGFSATVPQAVPQVRERVHYITEASAGWGAVREVADAIRKAQGHGP